MEHSVGFLNDMLQALATCTQEKRVEAFENMLAAALKCMDEDSVLEFRQQLQRRLPPGPEHQMIMDLIEGHLALRMIARTL